MTDRHPDRAALEQFLDGGLPEGESRILQRHLFLCPVCEDRMIALLPGSKTSPHPAPDEGYRGLIQRLLERSPHRDRLAPPWPHAGAAGRLRTLAGDRASPPRAAARADPEGLAVSQLGLLRAPRGPLAADRRRRSRPGGRPAAAGARCRRAVEPGRVRAGLDRSGQGPGLDLDGERLARARRLPAGRAGLPDSGGLPRAELARSSRRGAAPGAQGPPEARPGALRRGPGAARRSDRHLPRGQRAPPPGPSPDGQRPRPPLPGEPPGRRGLLPHQPLPARRHPRSPAAGDGPVQPHRLPGSLRPRRRGGGVDPGSQKDVRSRGHAQRSDPPALDRGTGGRPPAPGRRGRGGVPRGARELRGGRAGPSTPPRSRSTSPPSTCGRAEARRPGSWPPS